MEEKNLPDDPYVRKILIVIVLMIKTVFILFIIFYAIDVFLLLFTGILFAIFLSSIADWLIRHTRLSYKQGLVVVLMILTLTAVALIQWSVLPLSLQFIELKQTLPAVLEKTSQRLMEFPWFKSIVGHINFQGLMPDPKILLGRTAPRSHAHSRRTDQLSDRSDHWRLSGL